MVAPAVVFTAVAVCFVPDPGWFVVRCRIRVTPAWGESVVAALTAPLSRRQLAAECDGPELADFLTEHPGSWWHLPLPDQRKEGHGL